MRVSVCLLIVFLLAGSQSGTPPASEPDLVEPVTFSTWPSVTDKPIQVRPDLWALCRGPSPEEAKPHGPHMTHSIIVRVSPDAIAPFREGKRLPTGAVGGA
jgi:hypothetical protein